MGDQPARFDLPVGKSQHLQQNVCLLSFLTYGNVLKHGFCFAMAREHDRLEIFS